MRSNHATKSCQGLEHLKFLSMVFFCFQNCSLECGQVSHQSLKNVLDLLRLIAQEKTLSNLSQLVNTQKFKGLRVVDRMLALTRLSLEDQALQSQECLGLIEI